MELLRRKKIIQGDYIMRNNEYNANKDLLVSAAETASQIRRDKNLATIKAEQDRKRQSTIFMFKYLIVPMITLLVLALAYIAFKVFTK